MKIGFKVATMNITLLILSIGNVLAFQSSKIDGIHDPLGLFCGSQNCYDILNITRNHGSCVSDSEIELAYTKIKRKYRHCSTEYKNVQKANFILTKNATKFSYDNYLDNPSEYKKASANVRVINWPSYADILLLTLQTLLLFSYVICVSLWILMEPTTGTCNSSS